MRRQSVGQTILVGQLEEYAVDHSVAECWVLEIVGQLPNQGNIEEIILRDAQVRRHVGRVEDPSVNEVGKDQEASR
jgi:hypothetical protein